MFPPAARRPLLVVTLVCTIVLFVLSAHPRVPLSVPGLFPSSWRTPAPLSLDAVGGLELIDPAVAERLISLRNNCDAENPFELEYGRTNIRLSRAYEGSHHRLQGFINKILRGEAVTVAAIGGSVTKGHAVYPNEAWFWRLSEWFDAFIPNSGIVKVNGAAPATGSDYFSFCFPLHIPPESDLIFVELAVNDEALPEHVENMENLLRGLLAMPRAPAVVLVEVIAFSAGGMGGGGGRMHLPVAQYLDIPVINQRHPLASHFARFPQLVPHYFAQDWWGNPDMRHINARGHRDLSRLIASLVRDVACIMVGDDTYGVPAAEESTPSVVEALPGLTYDDQMRQLFGVNIKEELENIELTWPSETRSTFRAYNGEGNADRPPELWPGMWTAPTELGVIPRLRVLEGWNPHLDHRVPPFHPTCLSTRSKDPAFNLTPTHMDPGWEHWVHPEHLDKPYLVGRTPGARVSFELETSVGVVKMYSLMSKSFGLGRVLCWADDERGTGVVIDGWWDKGDLNIGRFATIGDQLEPGLHIITCEVLEESSDPDGGTEFRIISIMSV